MRIRRPATALEVGQGCAPSKRPHDLHGAQRGDRAAGLPQTRSPGGRGFPRARPGATFVHSRTETEAPLTSFRGFKESFNLFYLLIKGTWQVFLPGPESPGGGWEVPKDSRMRGAAGKPSPHGQRGPAASGLAGTFRPYEGPTSRRAWLGFPGLWRWRPHKDGIHGEALNSLRNEAGFK